MDPEFPCSITIDLPFPTHRLASSALRAIEVDTEISPLVHRSFNLSAGSAMPSQKPSSSNSASTQVMNAAPTSDSQEKNDDDQTKTVLQVIYKATTNRMLRVAVNGFMDTLGVVLGVMEELDVDVLQEELGRG